MISLEGRIARIELVLNAIYLMLPSFIKSPLAQVPTIAKAMEEMKKDADKTYTLKRDTH